MKKYLFIFASIVAVLATYFYVSSQLSIVSIVRVTKNCPTQGCNSKSILAEGSFVQMYFADKGGEPVHNTLPKYLYMVVSNKILSNANDCFKLALNEIHKNNLSGIKTDFNGLNFKWISNDLLGTNSLIKIWTVGTAEPETRPLNLFSLK